MIRRLIAIFYIVVVVIGGAVLLSQPAQSQELNFEKALADYDFTKVSYSQKLTDFNQKKAAYQKNPTLALKEELRLSLLTFLRERNALIRSYLTAIRFRTVESLGLEEGQKATVYTMIDTEVKWYEEYLRNYGDADSVETLLDKSTSEDTQWQKLTTPAVYFTLANISLGEVVAYRHKHEKIYEGLKSEANNLVSLGRADNSLFSRWFNDIEKEITNVKTAESKTLTVIEKLVNDKNTVEKRRLFDEIVKTLTPGKTSLLRLNNFIAELENVVQTKR